METINEMYDRHDRQMKELIEAQQMSWKALNEQHGNGNVPLDVYQQWDEQYGNPRLYGLRAQQYAEVEAYPLNPLEYRYQRETEDQKQQPVQDLTQKTPDLHQEDIFAKLIRKQKEQEQKPPGPGDDR